MRTFVAIDIDEKIRTAICDLQKKLRGAAGTDDGRIKWTDPSSIHLTLKFLGEVKDKEIAEVCEIVARTVAKHKNFDINVAQLGCFGRPAKVVWAGVDGKNAALRNLQQDLEDAFDLAGWPPEVRRFSAHLTVCRIKNSGLGAKLERIVENFGDVRLGSFNAKAACVYESKLTSAGPIYTLLSRSKLN